MVYQETCYVTVPNMQPFVIIGFVLGMAFLVVWALAIGINAALRADYGLTTWVPVKHMKIWALVFAIYMTFLLAILFFIYNMQWWYYHKHC